jgi:hypothetical protein
MRRAGVAVIAALATFVFAASAHAGCGGVRTAAPQRSPVPGGALAVGDSVLLGAIHAVTARGYFVNARGCRGMEETLRLLRDLRRRRRLPRLVVVSTLGANFQVTGDEFTRLFRILGPTRYAGLVTETASGQGADAALVRRVAEAHPRRTILLDWVRYSAGHGSWFDGDGLHLTRSGADAFARLLARALRAFHSEGRKVRS